MLDYRNINLNFLDIETTGGNYNRDKITEIYINKTRDGKTIDEFHTLINPERSLDPFITKLTGITNEMLRDAPTFDEIAEDLYQFINEEILVAHNARFDYSFLKHSLNQYGFSINANYCCTVKLSRVLYPRFKSHNLNSIIERLNYQNGERHRASYDTQVIKTFFYTALQEHGENKFQEAFNTAVKRAAIPPALLKIKMEDIPETPGVYLFYGKEVSPIYVGMSKNLRRRIYEHFYQDLTLVKDFNINQQLQRIEYIQTAGTLGAMIREAVLVKKYQPLYNRMLRRNRELIKLESYINENGYITLEIKKDSDFDINNIDNLVGLFRNKFDLVNRLNELVKTHGLCPRLVGLEKGKGGCFSYQLGYCKGACFGKISPEEYNQILLKSIQEIKLKQWPFEGERKIVEEGNGLKEEIIFNKWCFIHSSACDDVLNEYEKFKFDLDIYKILKRHLS